MIKKNLENALNDAFSEAQRRRHAFLTVEHLLYAILKTDEGGEIIEAVGGSTGNLIKTIGTHLDTLEQSPDDQEAPIQTVAFQRILQKAIMHLQSSEKKELEIGDVLAALFQEKESHARFFLEEQGITRLDIVEYISHGMPHLHDGGEDEDHDLEEQFMEDYQREFGSGSEEDESKKPFSRGQKKRARKESSQLDRLLEKYTTEMTAKASQGKYDVLVGREKELQRTIEILCRRSKNNPVHVGDPGVGKTAITQGLARLIVEDKVPDKLKGFKIYALDIGLLLAGAKFRGDFEERLKGVFQALEDQKAIVFIDEIHTVVGAGSIGGGSMDASNLLKPFLSAGSIRVIGSTTYEEYRQFFEKDRALSRRFQKVEIREPGISETVHILQGLRNRYEAYHLVEYSDSALKAAAELSARFIRDRFLPDKAIDVMDEAGASVSIYHPNRRLVTASDMEKLVARMAQIPLSAISHKEKNNLQQLEQKLSQVVFSQEKAIHKLVAAIKRHRSGLGHAEKPIGSFLFAGPTGVGKTELCRRLADELGIALLRFDMSEYMEKHSISRLLGSPPGYIGFDQGAQLTDAVRKNPHALLLLDEIEKAHPDIFNALLQVMDHATLTDSTGKTADFRNIILIMTSNAGSREMSSYKIGFNEKEKVSGDPQDEIKRMFSPEFRNRLDDIVLFHHLNRETVEKIVVKFLAEFQEQLRKKRIQLELSTEAIGWLAEKGYDPLFGARPMGRVIQEELKDPIVNEILFGRLKKGGQVKVGLENNAGEEKRLSFSF